MFDGIGFMELLLIGILGLVVLGPERLPVAVRSITGWIRAIKRMANSVKDELEQELKIEQLHADLKKAESKGLSNLSPELQQSIDELKQAAQSVNRPYKVEDINPTASTPITNDSVASVSSDGKLGDETIKSTADTSHSSPKSNG
ncbi:Sec-independent protein translocase protein TatB [Shewanella sp. OMA3-2]|uniref:Sec-independent protein translocase protein TatB n=1 Tax=Shewanella sp. OMA3-2 TaxID=2908650 RepID=UPI001F1A072F|nr:Sec-independent protein translocase protein TatB [Shewanella sp. OMA3-2]UJF21914.1 Sec-independent protein translocase protein TatB [Shewanella sp. OMA3-2]